MTTQTKHITIRYKTPSRPPVRVTVSQTQDELGDWMMPVIMVEEGRIAPYILESASYAEDTGKARIIAAYFANQFALRVKQDEAQKDERVDIEISEM